MFRVIDERTTNGGVYLDSGSSSYRRFLDGDEMGLVEIVRDYKDGLILYINSIVNNIHIAEELTEDTFVRLVVRRPADKGNSSFKTWLYTMGRNRAIDYLRHHKRHQKVLLDECADNTITTNSVEELYFREEKRRAVHLALGRLKPDYQQVLWLIYFENFSCKQAAKVMKKKVHAIEMLASRARKALSEELRKEGYTSEIL